MTKTFEKIEHASDVPERLKVTKHDQYLIDQWWSYRNRGIEVPKGLERAIRCAWHYSGRPAAYGNRLITWTFNRQRIKEANNGEHSHGSLDAAAMKKLSNSTRGILDAAILMVSGAAVGVVIGYLIVEFV